MTARAGVAIVVGLALGLGACGPGAAPPPAAPTIGNQLPAEARPARPAVSLHGMLAMMPADTDAVVALDAAQLRGAALWGLIERPLRDALGEGPVDVRRHCGHDLLTAFDQVLVGVRGTDADPIIFFARGVAQGPLSDCLTRLGVDRARRVRIDGELIEIVEGDQVTGRLLYVDAATLVTGQTGGTPLAAATLRAMAAAPPDAGLMSSAAFRAVLDRVDTQVTSWGIVNGTYAPLAQMPFKLRAIRAELVAGAPAHALAVTMTFETQDGGDAQSIAAAARLGVDQLRPTPLAELARAITVTERGTDVHVDVRLELAAVTRVFDAIRGPSSP